LAGFPAALLVGQKVIQALGQPGRQITPELAQVQEGDVFLWNTVVVNSTLGILNNLQTLVSY
jgi:hypothetical protein